MTVLDKVVFTKKGVEKYTNLGQFLNLLWYAFGFSKEDFETYTNKNITDNNMYVSEILEPSLFTKTKGFMTESGTHILHEVLSYQESYKFHTEKEYEEIATFIRNTFPKGKKPNSNTSWRESIDTIKDRFKILEIQKKKQKIDFELVKKATELYVNENKDNSYARTAGYFIFKDVNENGTIVQKSDLLTYIDKVKDGDTTEQSSETVTNVFI